MNTRKVFPAPEYTATFVENHDNPRWLYVYGDRAKFTNAGIFSADDNFYAYTIGNVLACFTNVQSSQYKITYHDFKESDKFCNGLYD